MTQAAKVDVVGVGLNATDTTIQIAEFPECGSKVEYDSERVTPGGQVASTVVACQKWGLNTRYVGKLGDDDAARLHAREFERLGVEAQVVYVPETASARSLILVDRRGGGAGWAREAGVPVVADLDEIYPGVDALIEKIDYLIVSRDFPCQLTGERSLKAALREIRVRYGCGLTAATLGPDGLLAWDGERFHHAPAFRVDVVDTTGAGDIFHAGFIYG